MWKRKFQVLRRERAALIWPVRWWRPHSAPVPASTLSQQTPGGTGRGPGTHCRPVVGTRSPWTSGPDNNGQTHSVLRLVYTYDASPHRATRFTVTSVSQRLSLRKPVKLELSSWVWTLRKYAFLPFDHFVLSQRLLHKMMNSKQFW